MLVDDSALALALIAAEFEDAGWEVIGVERSTEALALLRDGEQVDVIVCDLHMPELNGFEVTRAAAELAPEVPVVIHSSDHDVSAVLGAVRRGAFDYVLKSTDLGLLRASAERGAIQCRLVRENARLTGDLRHQLAMLNAARDTLSLAYQQAVRASAAKSVFLANMSHELRTPLNAIIGYVELVAEEVPSPQMAADLERALAAARHLHGLIGEVLDLSAIESGKLALTEEEVDLVPLLEDVVDLLRPAAVKRKNRLVVTAAGRPRARADAQRLRQVLLNLVGNACKFTSAGMIELSAARERDRVVVRVLDNGIGMTEDQLSRVFGAFEQASPSTKYEYGGTGLGLAISKALCEAMNGEVGATSEPGVGTCMTVELPSADAGDP